MWNAAFVGKYAIAKTSHLSAERKVQCTIGIVNKKKVSFKMFNIVILSMVTYTNSLWWNKDKDMFSN